MSALTLPTRAADAEPLKPPQQHLECSSCERPVFNSFMTPHGCRLCELCVQQLPQSDRVRCPGKTEACKDPDEQIDICQDDCVPDIATRREIAKLPVWCPNKSVGCREQMKWRDVEAHLEKCDFEKVQCQLCGKLIVSKQMKVHQNNECPQRLVKCDLCGATIVFSKMKVEHKNLKSPTCCPAYTAPCPYCGQANLTKQAFEEHKANCRERPTFCTFKSIGCNEEMPASKLEEHNREYADAHLSMMDRKLLQTSHSTSIAAPAATEAASAPGVTDKEMKDLDRRLHCLFEVFKKLQFNAASWADTTMNYEELLDSFGGINGFRSTLKRLKDRAHQIETGGSRVGVDSPATATEFMRLNEKISELNFRLQALELTNYEGVLMWKVTGVGAKCRQAREGHPESVFSPPFFMRRYGHVFRVCLSLNGLDSARGSHVSVSLVIVRGEYDDALKWPLVANVSFRLISVNDTSVDDKKSEALLDSQDQNKRPKDDSDISIKCTVLKFCDISQLQKYVKNDCLYLEVEVERKSDAATAGR